MAGNRPLNRPLIQLQKCSKDSSDELQDADYLETDGSYELLSIIFQSDAPCEVELTKQFLDCYSKLRAPLKMFLEPRKHITEFYSCRFFFLQTLTEKDKWEEQLWKSVFTDKRGEGAPKSKEK